VFTPTGARTARSPSRIPTAISSSTCFSSSCARIYSFVQDLGLWARGLLALPSGERIRDVTGFLLSPARGSAVDPRLETILGNARSRRPDGRPTRGRIAQLRRPLPGLCARVARLGVAAIAGRSTSIGPSSRRNERPSSTDALWSIVLNVLEGGVLGPSPQVRLYNGPITVSGPTRIRAAAFTGELWSTAVSFEIE
jgi:hypothetical protein